LDALASLFAVVLLLTALAPALIAGGQLIVAFMVRKRIGVHLVWCLSTLAALLGGAFIALQLNQGGQKLLGIAVLAALPWAAHWLCKRYVMREQTQEEPGQ
jgi:hypothetical protein